MPAPRRVHALRASLRQREFACERNAGSVPRNGRLRNAAFGAVLNDVLSGVQPKTEDFQMDVRSSFSVSIESGEVDAHGAIPRGPSGGIKISWSECSIHLEQVRDLERACTTGRGFQRLMHQEPRVRLRFVT